MVKSPYLWGIIMGGEHTGMSRRSNVPPWDETPVL